MKLWNEYNLNKEIEDFTVGEDYLLDQKLVKYDCLGSIAHAKMLGKIGILKKKEVQKLVEELNNIIELDKKGKFRIKREQEDCHTAIENYLTQKLGDSGKKIHTGRSRNDQVLTALRLYYREELNECRELTNKLTQTLKKFSKKYSQITFPGYTHFRKATPSSIGMWAGSFADSMEDNQKMIDMTLGLINQSPLGTGPGYGIPYLKLDRNYTAKLLGFKKVQRNPIYTQNSRGKFESTILHTLSQIMFDLNKIASDLIIFSMSEFGYFEIPREFCTGSTSMPQKRNPDALELVRAKYHTLTSYEFQIKNTISNLLSGYNRDLQLTKEPIMKGLELTKENLSIMNLIILGLKVKKENCQKALTEEIFATEKTYQLVKKGVPYREAYRKISRKYA